MSELKIEAEECKNKGNAYFKENKLEEALEWYSKAIDIQPQAVYYSNRAFVHIKLENYGSALEDSEAAIKLDKNYAKAYYRRGCAHLALSKLKDALQDFKQVLRIAPSDLIAQSKVKFVQKEIRRIEFEKAIESERTKLPSEQVNLKEIVVEDSYDGVRIDDEVVTMDFAKDVLNRFKSEKKLHRKYAIIILLKAIEHFKQLKSLFYVTVPQGKHFTVCGDTHGQFFDLHNIFAINGLPSKENPYLFNGDYVDRGSWSLEVMLTLFAFKVADPECLYLTRGNHESRHLNRAYGFEGEVKAKYNEDMFELFQEVFNWLPLAGVINQQVFVVHGGLCAKEGVTLSEIEQISRNRDIPEDGIFCDLLWSDPQKESGKKPNRRGTSIQFGPDVTQRFLETNGLNLVIRSHEVKQDGYEIDHNGKLITIFSAPNYCDTVGNYGAYIILRNEDGKKLTTEMKQFKAVPHPNVKAMAYSNSLYNFN